MKLGIKFEDGTSKTSGLGGYLIRNVVGKLLFAPHLSESWWETHCPVRIDSLMKLAFARLEGRSGGFVLMAADPHSNTVSLTVPRFAPGSSKVIFDLDHYDEAIVKEGWPVVVVTADEFPSFDCVNPNTIRSLDAGEAAEPEKPDKSE